MTFIENKIWKVTLESIEKDTVLVAGLFIYFYTLKIGYEKKGHEIGHEKKSMKYIILLKD